MSNSSVNSCVWYLKLEPSEITHIGNLESKSYASPELCHHKWYFQYTEGIFIIIIISIF